MRTLVMLLVVTIGVAHANPVDEVRKWFEKGDPLKSIDPLKEANPSLAELSKVLEYVIDAPFCHPAIDWQNSVRMGSGGRMGDFGRDSFAKHIRDIVKEATSGNDSAEAKEARLDARFIEQIVAGVHGKFDAGAATELAGRYRKLGTKRGHLRACRVIDWAYRTGARDFLPDGMKVIVVDAATRGLSDQPMVWMASLGMARRGKTKGIDTMEANLRTMIEEGDRSPMLIRMHSEMVTLLRGARKKVEYRTREVDTGRNLLLTVPDNGMWHHHETPTPNGRPTYAISRASAGRHARFRIGVTFIEGGDSSIPKEAALRGLNTVLTTLQNVKGKNKPSKVKLNRKIRGYGFKLKGDHEDGTKFVIRGCNWYDKKRKGLFGVLVFLRAEYEKDPELKFVLDNLRVR